MYGSLICEWYDRIVIGDYGAFIEFPESAIRNNFEVEKGQEYRINDERYSSRVKYHWENGGLGMKNVLDYINVKTE